MNISTGIIQEPIKVVVYGAEGIGKSTFASEFPNPLFIDTEGSTKQLNVRRFTDINTWKDILDAADYVAKNPSQCKTLVLDTADRAEQMCIAWVCQKNAKAGLEDFGYGKGYTYIAEEFNKLIVALDKVIAAGVNVVVTAHAYMRKFEQPDEMGAYDRWELKLSKKVAPLLKEWSDMLLFANYKTIVISDGSSKKAQGGKRVMYTSHHPCWDAKNRFGMKDELPFEYKQICGCVPHDDNFVERMDKPTVEQTNINREKIKQQIAEFAEEDKKLNNGTHIPGIKEKANRGYKNAKKDVPDSPYTPDELLPFDKLTAMMKEAGVTAEQVEKAVSERGKMPANVKLKDYPEKMITGYCIKYFDKLIKVIKESK